MIQQHDAYASTFLVRSIARPKEEEEEGEEESQCPPV